MSRWAKKDGFSGLEEEVKDRCAKEAVKVETVAGVKIEPRVIAATGSSRSDRTGKGRYDLIPPCAIRRLALRFEGGAVAHGDRNWQKGMDASRCFDSAMRHLWKWSGGEMDEDHLGAAMWNIAALMYIEEKMPQHLDIPDVVKSRTR